MKQISPKYRIHLIEKISEAIWEDFGSYSKVLAYIKEWQQWDWDGSEYIDNFTIAYKDQDMNQIDVFQTLSNMDGELTIKIAIDLGIETPDFIPSIPLFRNEIKDHYSNASDVFDKAFVESDPSLAIGLANSALESILKDACLSLRIEGYNEHSTSSELIKKVMTRFRDSNPDFPDEIKQIANNLSNASNRIEDIRSDKTDFHGKSSGCSIIDNPSYAYFIVNAVATIGLFIINYQKENTPHIDLDSISDLPF